MLFGVQVGVRAFPACVVPWRISVRSLPVQHVQHRILHGFRSTYRVWAMEVDGVSLESRRLRWC